MLSVSSNNPCPLLLEVCAEGRDRCVVQKRKSSVKPDRVFGMRTRGGLDTRVERDLQGDDVEGGSGT